MKRSGRFHTHSVHGPLAELAHTPTSPASSAAPTASNAASRGFPKLPVTCSSLSPGKPNLARGVREFVVGTGGYGHQAFTTVRVGSQVRNTDAFEVLELTLRPGGYQWRFRPVTGGAFTDTGAADCH
jgi:hypothetical protein